MECIAWVNMIGIIARINVYNAKKLVNNVRNTVKNAPPTMEPAKNNCVTLLNHCDCMRAICLHATIWNSTQILHQVGYLIAGHASCLFITGMITAGYLPPEVGGLLFPMWIEHKDLM